MRLLLAALLLTTPALAQSQTLPAVDLAAIAIGGFSDGVKSQLLFPGTIAKTGPGQFTLVGAERQTNISVVETEKCVFGFTFATAGEPSIGLHIDANKISGFTVTPDGDYDGVPKYAMLITGAPGRVMFDLSTGPVNAPDDPTKFVTTLPLADIESAIVALRTTYCPGLAA
jgi:hypothetical protein